MKTGDKGSKRTCVLVTGGTGCAGSALVRLLVRERYKVRVLVPEGEAISSLEGLDVEIHTGDIRRPETLGGCVGSVKVVFHLAAHTADWGTWDRFRAVDVHGTRNMVRLCERGGVRRLVHMSSLAVHGQRPYFGADETAPLDATSDCHAASERLAEEEIVKAQQRGALETVIIRPAVAIYGPRDPHGWGRILERLEKGRFALVNRGKALTGVIHVGDLARGLVLSAFHPRAAGETFVLSDPVPVSWRKIIQTLCRHLNVPVPRISVPSSLASLVAHGAEAVYDLFGTEGEPPITRYGVRVCGLDLFFSPAKAQRILGYRTGISFSEGAREMVEWYRNEYLG